MTQRWDSEERARALVGRRDELLSRFPREIRAAGEVRPDVRELIVDEAIGYVAMEHKGTIATEEDLEHLFWGACVHRVRRALYRHAYETVRGKWRPASADALDHVAGGSNPETEVIRRDEQHTALEFAATLTPRERDVFASKYGGAAERGYKEIAQRLGMSRLQVRSAESAIDRKLDRFATIVAAGRLCGYRAPTIASLAAGGASEDEVRAAQAHLVHCAPCTTDYKRHLHYLQSAAFGRKVAAVLPVPPAAAPTRPGAAVRDMVTDFLARPFGSDAASSTAQLGSSGVGRGAGAAVAAKLVALCLAGGGTLGICTVTGVLPPLGGPPDRPDPPTRRSQASEVRRSATPDRLPTRAEAHLIPTPTPTPRPRRRVHRQRATPTSTGQTAQGGTSATSHEQPLASPPVTGTRSSTPGGAEFNFERSSSNAQPQPAPPPRAPGSREFP